MRNSIGKTAGWLGLLGFFGVLVVAACDQQAKPKLAANSSPLITIGGKGYTEQVILLKILSVYLKEKGYDVVEVPNMASGVARAALVNGRIDMYWEYTGTALVMYLGRPAEANPEAAYATVKKLDQANGLVWLDMSSLNSSYVILMRRDKARQLGIVTLTDLAAWAEKSGDKLLFASSPEFAERKDGLQGLEKRYGFEFQQANVSKMDTDLLYGTLKDDQVDVIAGIATDGRIARYGLVELKDDQSFFPAYNAAPVVRKALLKLHPELVRQINQIPGLLDNETMMELTSLVDVEHEEVIKVVRDWLNRQDLI